MSSLFGIGANGAADFYNGDVTNSVKFDQASSAILTKSVSTGASRKQSTFAWWLKRGQGTIGQYNIGEIFCQGGSGGGGTQSSGRIILEGDKLHVSQEDNNSVTWDVITTQVFRDFSTWYHFAVVIDTPEAAAADRVRVYVNGKRVTSFSTSTYPSQDLDTRFGLSGTNRIGHGEASGSPWTATYLDAYIADMYYLDGVVVEETAGTINSFGEFNTGIWIPKEYSGSYGTNGFRFQFKQTGTGTASTSTIGADTSGNGNHYTTSGFTATDSNRLDCPENNFATTLGSGLAESTDYQSYYSPTVNEGNLKITGSASGWTNGSSNFGMTSGKWYAEVRIGAKHGTNYIRFGMRSRPARTYDEYFWVDNGDGQIDAGSSPYSSRVGTYTAGDKLMIALDLDNNALYFGKNGTWENSATASEIAAGTVTNAFASGTTLIPNAGPTGDGHAYFFYCQPHSTGSNITWNFGQDSSFAGAETAQGNTDGGGIGDFFYAVPSGFLALCSVNLSEPSIGPNSATQADNHYKTLTYTGNGSDGRSITGVGFKPDLNWIKNRSNSGNDHIWTDTSRGGDRQIITTGAYAENNATNKVESLDADGFTFGQSVHSSVNSNSHTYVSWNWKANGGSTTTNDASETGVGTIDSVYQANTDAGFSIVLFTGTGSAGTVAHGLSQKPDVVIIKNRTDGREWLFGHTYNSFSGQQYLSTTGAYSSNSGSFNNTAPTSTVFTVNSDQTANEGSDLMIAYCFHSVEGYSKFEGYTGNGNANGPFIYTGFRPAFIMTKLTSGTGNWYINDSGRSPANPTNSFGANLYAESTAVESGNGMDMVSNGFKIRNTDGSQNTSSGTHLYMAFAEHPFKYTNAR